MSDRVANWDSVIHKIVRSNEGNLIGNVDAVDEILFLFLVKGEGQDIRYQNILSKVSMVMKCH